jgi:aspartate aminotransferase
MKLSNRIRLAKPLATTAMHGRVEAMKARGQDIIDLSVALSNYPAPASVIEQTRASLDVTLQPYTSVMGAEQLRRVLADKLKKENDIEAAGEEIIVTNGAKQAVFESLYVLTDPGDAVLIFRPHWPAYVATAELLGLKAILVDLPEQITAALLDALPPAKVLIINSPHNPTGKVFTREELSAICDWAARRKCAVISDESYEKLVYEGRHISIASVANWRELGIISIFSASQSYAMMGWRVGFAVGPAKLVAAMDTLQGPITAAASAFTQVACGAAFSAGDPVEMVEDYRERRKIPVDLLAPVPWITMHLPDAGPYLWGDISSLTMDSLGFVETLLEQEKVALMPGDALGMPGFIRLTFVSDDAETLRRATRAIIRHGERLALRLAETANA